MIIDDRIKTADGRDYGWLCHANAEHITDKELRREVEEALAEQEALVEELRQQILGGHLQTAEYEYEVGRFRPVEYEYNEEHFHEDARAILLAEDGRWLLHVWSGLAFRFTTTPEQVQESSI